MAQKNRLKLDFSLVTNTERNQFIQQYLTSEMFANQPPTEEELTTMADYILWGKDECGRTGKQQGFELHTKHGTWDESPIDSLEQLLEAPTFSESSLSPLGATQYRAKKEVFSREDALAKASPIVQQSFRAIFAQIDELEMCIGLYDLAHGKRTKELRSELTKKFSEEEICRMRERVSHWNQYKYLKMRHQLVELRREQYTLRDSYRQTLLSQDDSGYQEPETYEFDVDIEVLPLGLAHNQGTAALIFRAWRELDPNTIAEEDLRLISNLYWEKQGFTPSAYQTWIDFRELEHVYQLLNFQNELEEIIPEKDINSNLEGLLRTLQFYVEQADLTDIQREILNMKLNKKKNTDIAWDINHKYGKTYTPNYISTIFRQRIIPRINEAATMHLAIVENIFYPENFKRCTGCGEIMLKCPENFTRKSRAGDGYSSRCKRCEKKARIGT